MSEEHLEIDVASDQETLTLVLRGEVDAHTAPRLDGEIQAGLFTSDPARLQHLVLDFSGVSFLDSSGLRVVIAAHRSMRERDGSLVLRRPSPTVQRLLEITQLTGELQIEA